MGDKAWSSEVAEHIAQATLATDRQGRIVYANPAARQQCGLTETELLSRTLGDVFRLDGGLRMMLERCLRRGESASFETEVCGGDDGSGRLVQVSVSPMRTDGTTAGLVIVASDITERRRAEAALWESQRALSTLLSNLPGMAYRCANDPDWTMEYLSEGCLALTGYPPSDLSEKRVLYNDPDRRQPHDRRRDENPAEARPAHRSRSPPRVSPRARWRWRTPAKTSAGRTERSAAAAISPYSSATALLRRGRYTVTVAARSAVN